jgi:hypothetical protein
MRINGTILLSSPIAHTTPGKGGEQFDRKHQQRVSHRPRDALSLFEEVGEPHRSDQVFHLSLLPKGAAPCLSRITF